MNDSEKHCRFVRCVTVFVFLCACVLVCGIVGTLLALCWWVIRWVFLI